MSLRLILTGMALLGVLLVTNRVTRFWGHLSQRVKYFNGKRRGSSATNRYCGDEKQRAGYSTSRTDPPPQPTPLMITPDQVKTYDDRPWRPFRWPYHQTMSIYKLDVNHWLDMDKYYWHYLEEKQRIIHAYNEDTIALLPEAEEGCVELMETVRSHMLQRYPLLFSSSDGISVYNHLTQTLLDMSEPLKEHPLVYVSMMAKEDFYLVQERADGGHFLTAGVVPFPGGLFSVRNKLGQNLDAIHTDVPDYESKLKYSMEKWFKRMEPADLTERATWYCSWDHKLKRSNIYTLKAGETVSLGIPPTEFNVRIERQTLRRLPKSRVIVFTNHPVFYLIEEMKDEPLVPSLLKKIVFEAPESIIKYKSFEKFRDHLLEYLNGLINRQMALGLITSDTPVKTLPSYPFAHYIATRDAVHGWPNPSAAKEPNYTKKAKDEITGDGD